MRRINFIVPENRDVRAIESVINKCTSFVEIHISNTITTKNIKFKTNIKCK